MPRSVIGEEKLSFCDEHLRIGSAARPDASVRPHVLECAGYDFGSIPVLHELADRPGRLPTMGRRERRFPAAIGMHLQFSTLGPLNELPRVEQLTHQPRADAPPW
jgi:hypothetical protein